MQKQKKWDKRIEKQHALMWQACRKTLGNGYLAGVALLCNRYCSKPRKKLLDNACGSGTLVELAKEPGVEMYFSDGSEIMAGFTKQALGRVGVGNISERVFVALWQNLPYILHEKGFGRMDMMLNFGNSLPYPSTGTMMESDGKNFEDKAKEDAVLSLAGMQKGLADDGVFIFELYTEVEDPPARYGMYGDKKVICTFENDWDDRMRIWRMKFEGGETIDLPSLLIPHSEFLDLLIQAGFKKVEKVPKAMQIEPKYYVTYVAMK